MKLLTTISSVPPGSRSHCRHLNLQSQDWRAAMDLKLTEDEKVAKKTTLLLQLRNHKKMDLVFRSKKLSVLPAPISEVLQKMPAARSGVIMRSWRVMAYTLILAHNKLYGITGSSVRCSIHKLNQREHPASWGRSRSIMW